MNRKIKIPSLNEGKEFEVPERKVKHTRYTLRKTINSPEKMRSYDIGFYSVYVVLKDRFPDITEDDIENLEDDELNKLSIIIWGEPDKDFRQTKPKKE